MQKKRLLLFGVVLATILLAGCIQQTSNKQPIDIQNKCSSDYTISCLINTGQKLVEVTKENIPCSSDGDCSITNLENFCSPGFPNVLKCLGEKYYCGEDKYCKRCDDSCGKNYATNDSDI